MTKGVEVKVPIEIRPNKKVLDVDYIFECIFYRVRSSDKLKKEAWVNSQNARKLFELICRPGGLNDSEWLVICGILKLTQGEWQYLTKKLRASGLIKKDGHIYRPNRVLLNHLQDIAGILYRYYLDLGMQK